MTNPIESPGAFAVNWCMHPTCSGGDKPDPCCVGLAAAIRSRDAAVRREARKAALLEAGTVCADEAADWGRLAGHTAEQMEGRYAAEAARLAVKLRALAGGSDAC